MKWIIVLDHRYVKLNQLIKLHVHIYGKKSLSLFLSPYPLIIMKIQLIKPFTEVANYQFIIYISIIILLRNIQLYTLFYNILGMLFAHRLQLQYNQPCHPILYKSRLRCPKCQLQRKLWIWYSIQEQTEIQVN